MLSNPPQFLLGVYCLFIIWPTGSISDFFHRERKGQVIILLSAWPLLFRVDVGYLKSADDPYF